MIRPAEVRQRQTIDTGQQITSGGVDRVVRGGCHLVPGLADGSEQGPRGIPGHPGAAVPVRSLGAPAARVVVTAPHREARLGLGDLGGERAQVRGGGHDLRGGHGLPHGEGFPGVFPSLACVLQRLDALGLAATRSLLLALEGRAGVGDLALLVALGGTVSR